MRLVPLDAAAESEAMLVCIPSGAAMAMFRYCLEADGHGLAMATVVDPQRGIVKLLYSPHQREELEEFLGSLQAKLGLEWRPWPHPCMA